MGDELTCRKAMRAGQLVRPFDLSIKSPQSYFLVTDYAKIDHAAQLAFTQWLKSRLSQTRNA